MAFTVFMMMMMVVVVMTVMLLVKILLFGFNQGQGCFTSEAFAIAVAAAAAVLLGQSPLLAMLESWPGTCGSPAIATSAKAHRGTSNINHLAYAILDVHCEPVKLLCTGT